MSQAERNNELLSHCVCYCEDDQFYKNAQSLHFYRRIAFLKLMTL